jgi:hypothetical protein
MVRLFQVSLAAAGAMLILVILFPWQDPPPQVEAIFGLGAVGMVVSGAVLLRRLYRRRVHSG